jgi:predicted nucleic acid-binding protein
MPAVAAPVYLDTSVAVTSVESGIPHHRACAAFCDGLRDAGTEVVVSQLVRVEFLNAWFRLSTSPYLQPDTVRRYRLRAWDRDAMVRDSWMVHGVAMFDRFLDSFAATTEVPLNRQIIAASIPLMARHRLRSLDAVHVATALFVGVSDFAAVDEDFRRVPNLRFVLLRDASVEAGPDA